MRRPALRHDAGRWPALLLAAAALAVVAGCGGDGGASDGAAARSTAGCTSATVPEPQKRTGKEPAAPLSRSTTYTMTFTTNCGTFVVTLDQATAPATSASLVALARAGFYDGTIVHRIVPGFVIQGGDPTQTGGGGPGYSTVDPPPAGAAYVKGVVAMAKTQLEARGTAGSQWFIVTGDDVGLPPDYAVVGKVTSGLDVVERIGRLGDASEQPTEPVVVESVTVGET